MYRNNEPSQRKSRRLRYWKITAIVFIVISVALVAGIIATAMLGKSESEKMASGSCTEALTERSTNQPKTCVHKSKPAADSSRSEKMFSGLSHKEVDEVIKFMKSQKDLKLVDAANATTRDNYIYAIEDYIPDKKEVTAYLDRKTSTQPIRKARVILFLGQTRKVDDYLVWPIPKPRMKQKFFANHDNRELSWKSRPICNVVEAPEISEFVIEQLSDNIEAIYFASFAASKECTQIKDCIYFNVAPRAVLNSPDRHMILWFFIGADDIAAYYMYPLPFYLIVSVPAGGSKFKIVSVYYNDHKFDSLSELKDEYYKTPSIQYKLPDLNMKREEYGSPSYLSQVSGRADQTQRPPRQYSPDGARFDVRGQHVEWLGWEFDIHSRTVTGLQVFDVKYNKERIAYELSMQDIVVMYSGDAPDDFFKTYFDNGWSIGRYNLPLIRGVDCPSDAIYLNSSVYAVGEDRGIVLNDAICVFEHRNSVPLRRHYSTKFFEWGYRYAFSMPDSVLIVRQIITVWNYDYVFDYEFHQNGMIEVKVSSTGYIAVTPNIKSSATGHGYVLKADWNAVANLHQHLFNFKLDLDIAGTANSFKTIDIVSERHTTDFSASEPWFEMVARETEIESESESALSYKFEEPKQYVIYNKGAELYRGSTLKRGYKIQTNGFNKVVIPDEWPMLNGASWAKYQVAVTKFDEKERTTASYFVQGDPFEPAINFDDFFTDNDNLKDTDLVAWVTVGIHHLPTYEDLPVTTTPGKTLSISLAPFNYFKRDPSIFSRDAAVFWHKSLNMTTEFLHKNDTCLPLSNMPELNIE